MATIEEIKLAYAGAPSIAEKLNKARSVVRMGRDKDNRASRIGDPCLRYLYLARVVGDQFKPVDAKLASIFREGGLHERAARSEIANTLQIDILEVGTSKDIRENGETLCTCHVDGVIRDLELAGLGPAVWECKSMNDIGWEAIPVDDHMRCWDAFDYFINSPKRWLNRYPAQGQMYLYGAEMEWMLMHAKNKLTGQYKELIFGLDYGYCEGLLVKARKVNEAVATQTTPDEGLFDGRCFICEAFDVCNPVFAGGGGLQMSDDAALLEALRDRKASAEGHRAYDRAMKVIKERYKLWREKTGGNELVVGGEFALECKAGSRAAQPAKPAIKTETIKVHNLGPGTDDDDED